MLKRVLKRLKGLPQGMRRVAPYLALPGVVLFGLLVTIGPDIWFALYAWGKGVCQMYLADLSLARVALDLGKLLAAAAGVAILAVMLREGYRLRLLRRSLDKANCTAVSEVTCKYPVFMVDAAVPFAFCRGILRPRIYVSTGLEKLLTTEELDAVLAHEEVHARRRDPLRVLAAHVAAAALFPIPLSRFLRDRYLAWLEVSADSEAVGKSGPVPLAGALLKLIQHSPVPDVLSSTLLVSPFNVTEERIKRLLGGEGASRPSPVPARFLLANGVMLASAGLDAIATVYGMGIFFQAAPLCEVTGSVF
jgi:Zn-dependent protease with chaperone function